MGSEEKEAAAREMKRGCRCLKETRGRAAIALIAKAILKVEEAEISECE